MKTFEGSYLGAADKISPLAIMECRVCWTPCDPAEGDEMRQIDPGTPFAALPEDWSCPNCSAPAAQFLVREDPGAPHLAEMAALNAATKGLVADFTEIWNAKMRDVPIVNKVLHVQAVGRGPLWRVVARSYDLQAILDGAPLSAETPAPGRAQVPATRGLYTVVAAHDGTGVTAFARTTPTDHLRAAGGVLDMTLATLPADRATLAPLVLDILDPCSPIRLREVRHA